MLPDTRVLLARHICLMNRLLEPSQWTNHVSRRLFSSSPAAISTICVCHPSDVGAVHVLIFPGFEGEGGLADGNWQAICRGP